MKHNLRAQALLAIVGISATAQAQCENQKLIASDGAAQQWFGRSVAMTETRLVVGARLDDSHGLDTGAVYVYELGATGWEETAKLVAAVPEIGAEFGSSVALSGNTIVIGSWLDDAAGFDSGTAYVFEYDGSSWLQTAELLSPNVSSNEFYGSAVALDGQRLVVAAQRGQGLAARSGKALIFEKSGTDWFETAVLMAPDGQAMDEMGRAVALAGERVLLGAFQDDDLGFNAGSAYVFAYDGSSWAFEAKLLASQGASNNQFGGALALEGDRALIGGEGLLEAAYIFERGALGWAETARLTTSDAGFLDCFGVAVSLCGERALVAAREDDNDGYHDSGAAYVFEWNGAAWEETLKFHHCDGHNFDHFGVALALGEERAVVSTIGDVDHARGAVYSFTFERGTSYCSAANNSTGAGAMLTAPGNFAPSIAANELVLRAEPVPNEPGIFFYGPQPMVEAFGDGYRCVGGGIFRILPVIFASGHVLERGIDYTTLPAAGAITAGSTWCFQAWYRDPALGNSGFNLSNGLELTFVP